MRSMSAIRTPTPGFERGRSAAADLPQRLQCGVGHDEPNSQRRDYERHHAREDPDGVLDAPRIVHEVRVGEDDGNVDGEVQRHRSRHPQGDPLQPLAGCGDDQRGERHQPHRDRGQVEKKRQAVSAAAKCRRCRSALEPPAVDRGAQQLDGGEDSVTEAFANPEPPPQRNENRECKQKLEREPPLHRRAHSTQVME